MGRGRLTAGIIVAAMIASGCSDSGAGSNPALPPPETTGRTIDGVPLAGEVGPGGGIVEGDWEMEAGPDSMYSSQKDPTAVTSVLRHFAGVSAYRRDNQLCISVTQQPDVQTTIAEVCDLPAYRTLDEVQEIGVAREAHLTTEKGETRIVFGATYLDVATVGFDDSDAVQTPATVMPFWMQRFFALPAPEAATHVLLLSQSGDEMARLAIVD